jgi:hypothetical protein
VGQFLIPAMIDQPASIALLLLDRVDSLPSDQSMKPEPKSKPLATGVKTIPVGALPI